MPTETYVGCDICLQPGAFDCQSWCKYQHPKNTDPCRGVLCEMVRIENDMAKVRSTEIKVWVFVKVRKDGSFIYPINGIYE
jgi:hypothetical protein